MDQFYLLVMLCFCVIYRCESSYKGLGVPSLLTLVLDTTGKARNSLETLLEKELKYMHLIDLL